MLAKSALIALAFGFCLPAPTPPPQEETHPALMRSSPAPQRVSFDAQVKPLLEKRCQPCHFAGGKMYARLPFDRPETIQALGEKLFTRIRDEKERSLLRSFLAQEATETQSRRLKG